MVYLDNAATTKPFDYIQDLYNDYSKYYWFNPSSIYKNGFKVKKLILESKTFIKNAFNLNEFELFYTFSGTFSNNVILSNGTLKNIHKNIENKIKRKIENPEIVVGIWEHSSIINPVKNLNRFKIKYINLKEYYKLFLKEINLKNYNKNKEDDIYSKFKKYIIEKFSNAISDSTILVTCMWVHNENGIIFPITDISKKIKKKNPYIFFHVDATQGFMKLPFFNSKYVDSITAASHKFHSIRGLGFLFLKDSSLIKPLIFGGGQEKGIVPSTENIFPIFSTFEVIKREYSNIGKYLEKSLLLKNYLEEKVFSFENKLNHKFLFFNNFDFYNLTKNTNDIKDTKNKINKSKLNYNLLISPYINRIYINNAKAEVIVNALSEKNIFISPGSACSSNAKKKINNIALDDNSIFGIPSNFTDGAIRISFGYFSKKEDVDIFVNELFKILEIYF